MQSVWLYVEHNAQTKRANYYCKIIKGLLAMDEKRVRLARGTRSQMTDHIIYTRCTSASLEYSKCFCSKKITDATAVLADKDKPCPQAVAIMIGPRAKSSDSLRQLSPRARRPGSGGVLSPAAAPTQRRLACCPLSSPDRCVLPDCGRRMHNSCIGERRGIGGNYCIHGIYFMVTTFRRHRLDEDLGCASFKTTKQPG